MDEIERKVDMLISGMKMPPKKTRRRVATIAASVLIAMTLIASASLITMDYYYKQTGTIEDVKAAITITDSLGEHDAPWQDTVTIDTLYAGDTYITASYTITNYGATKTIYIHIEVTEDGQPITNGLSNTGGDGLLVEVYNSDPNPITQFLDLVGSEPFTIHVTADPKINAASTYAYTITIDWNSP